MSCYIIYTDLNDTKLFNIIKCNPALNYKEKGLLIDGVNFKFLTTYIN